LVLSGMCGCQNRLRLAKTRQVVIGVPTQVCVHGL
jgi:hypothetical protein